MDMQQIQSRMRRIKFIQYIKSIRSSMQKVYNAKWFEIQCLSCGTKNAGTPDFLKSIWQYSGCNKCHSKLGYSVIETSNYQRQRVYYREPITNELKQAPIHDLAYKISRKNKENKQNYSLKADLKNDSLLRRPSMNRTRKMLSKKPKYEIEFPEGR